MAVGAINYIDRAALSLIAPLISKDLGLSTSQLGIVFSAFFVGYAIFCFIGGYFSDRIGPKRAFIIAATVWSTFCALTGTVFSFASLLIVRVIFGFGEGPFASTGSKMVNNWFGVTERGRAGNPIGGAIAGPFAGLLALTIGWRWAFLVVGLLGILWVTIWAVTVSDKPGREATGPAAKADATLVVHQSIGFYIRQPIILFAALAFFGWNYILYFFLSWFPTYLTAANMSIVTIIPWLVGFVGLASGGFFVDWVVIRSGNALHARKMILVAGLLVAAICVGFASPCSMPAMPTALARPPHPRQRPPKAKLRRQRPDWEVPDFAPAGGGIASVVLFLFEKPGPKTAQAGGRIFFNQQRRSIRCRDV